MRKGHLVNSLEKEGRHRSTWLRHFRSKARLLSAPWELEEANAFSAPVGGREGPAGAIVGLTMENGFQRQVGCFLRSRKIKPISAAMQESVRAATSEGTKRRETMERRLSPASALPLPGRKMGFTTFSL